MASLSSPSNTLVDLSATSDIAADVTPGEITAVEPSTPRPHTTYYFADGTVTFLVKNTLFRVHRYLFERESDIFRNLFTQYPFFGTQDDTIIPLTECPCEGFESLLQIFYNEHYGTYDLPKDSWKSVIALSFQWQMSKVFALAKTHLGRLLKDPIELIELQIKYAIDPEWAVNAYVKLVQRTTPLSIDEAKRVGLETMVIVQMAKLSFTTHMALVDKTRQCIRQVYGKEASATLDEGTHIVKQGQLQQSQASAQNPASLSQQGAPNTEMPSHSSKAELIFPASKTTYISPIPTGSGNDTFVPYIEPDSQGPDLFYHHQTISCLPSFRHVSLEEIRVADRLLGRNVGAAPAQEQSPYGRKRHPMGGYR